MNFRNDSAPPRFSLCLVEPFLPASDSIHFLKSKSLSSTVKLSQTFCNSDSFIIYNCFISSSNDLTTKYGIPCSLNVCCHSDCLGLNFPYFALHSTPINCPCLIAKISGEPAFELGI